MDYVAHGAQAHDQYALIAEAGMGFRVPDQGFPGESRERMISLVE
jgi:hypothetical protein